MQVCIWVSEKYISEGGWKELKVYFEYHLNIFIDFAKIQGLRCIGFYKYGFNVDSISIQ